MFLSQLSERAISTAENVGTIIGGIILTVFYYYMIKFIIFEKKYNNRLKKLDKLLEKLENDR